MAETPDDLDSLILDVRKTISDNKLFLEKLVDEATEADDDESETGEADGDFEEL